MRHGITISAVLHGGVIALALFGVPELWRRPTPVVETAVVVELVKVADVTTPKVEPKPEPKPEPVQEAKVEEPPAPPKPAPPPPKPVEAKAPPPPPEPEPVKLPEPKPEPPKPEVAKLETPKPEPKPEPPKPEPKKVEKAPEPKAPAPKPVAKPEPPKPDFDPNRLAALLDKRAEPAPQPAKAATKPTESRTESKPMEQVARRLGEELTVSEVDAIRAQIQRCWSVPAGARDAEDLSVRIRVFLRPDGSLARPPEILDQARMSLSGQEFFRTAAESARRAVLRCSPLRDLPQEKYERWRELTLTFDPKEMVSG